MSVGSLSHLTVKLEKTYIVVKGIRGCVGHPGSVLPGMIVHVGQEGEGEFVSCPGMRKAEGLGTGCEMSWRVALNTDCCVWVWWSAVEHPMWDWVPAACGTLLCRRRMPVDAEETLYFLFWSSALQSRQRPLDPMG